MTPKSVHRDEPFLPASNRSTLVILGCVLGSLALHGVAYAVLEDIKRPPVKQRTSEDIVKPNPAPPPKVHEVELEKEEPKELPPPESLPEERPAPPRPKEAPRLAPEPPKTPKEPPKPSKPVLDLTMGAGVNPELTSDSGDFSVHTGDTALGDPTVAPKPAPPPMVAPPPAAEPPPMDEPPPPMRPRPPPVYVKVLPQVMSVEQVPYPPAARRGQVEGTVTLEVTVGTDGSVIAVKVVRGIGYGLDEAATRALRNARFKPAVGSDGRPMVYTLRYRYTFRIER